MSSNGGVLSHLDGRKKKSKTRRNYSSLLAEQQQNTVQRPPRSVPVSLPSQASIQRQKDEQERQQRELMMQQQQLKQMQEQMEQMRLAQQQQQQSMGLQQQPMMQQQQQPVVQQTASAPVAWGQPKVWEAPVTDTAQGGGLGTQQQTNRGISKNNTFGDPDEQSDFLTASDKQGRLYRNDEASKKEIEAELFGADRHVAAGIDFDKYDDIPVESSGHDIPEPLNSFEDANLNPALLANIRRVNYNRPTPIQKHAIPMAINKRDIMACAQTGSGKTAAFLFPMINDILSNPVNTRNNRNRNNNRGGGGNYRGRGSRCVPRGLVLAPTRELASQIFEEAMRFTYDGNVRCVVLYGGADVRSQIQELNRGCDIVVATPGRLMDLAERGRLSFRCTKWLVLDEADRMLDMGFEPQIRRIVDEFDLSRERQTSMFSATFPQDIQDLAQDFMGDYIFVTVGRVGGTTNSITQNVQWVEEQDKIAMLVRSLKQVPGLTLVFVEMKRSADMLHNHLYRAENILCSSIHGDRSQRDREKALWEFSSGRVTVLIATDVAARGLDIPDVAHVINYDMPNDIDSYVHRIGRTGRAGNKGIATSFINEKNAKVADAVVTVLEDSQQQVPGWLKGLLASSREHRSRGGGGRRGRGKGNFGGRDNRRGRSSGSGRSGRGRGGGNRRQNNGGNRGGGGQPKPSTDSW